MTFHTKDIWRKEQFALLVLSAVWPIAPTLFCTLIPHNWALCWIFPPLFLVLSCFGVALRKKVRTIFGWAGAVLILGTGIRALLPQIEKTVDYALLVTPVIFSAAFLYALYLADLPKQKEPHGVLFGIGCFLYFIWVFTYSVNLNVEGSVVGACAPGVTIIFAVFLSMFLLSRNRSGLQDASAGRFHLPPAVARINHYLILILIGGILILGLVPSVANILAMPFQLVGKGLEAFMALMELLFQGDISYETIPTEATEPAEPPVFEPEKVSPSVTLPEVVMYLIAILFVAFVVYIVLRGVFLLYRLLVEKFRNMISYTKETAYQDEVSDVRDTVSQLKPEKKLSVSFFGIGKPALPAEQIRHRYRILKKRHAKWSSADTVRQQLPEEAAALYERVRYGGQDATPEDARAFEKNTRSL